MPNKYDALFAGEEARLKGNKYDALFATEKPLTLRGAASTTPEQFNTAVGQSRASGVPLPVVRRNPEEAALLAREALTNKVLEQYPTLGPILLRDENAANTLLQDAAALGPLTENPLFKKVPTPRISDRFTVGSPAGLVAPGNIDIWNRPRVPTENGLATVRSMSVNIDGREVLLPTVSPEGALLSDEQAIDLYKRTGQHLGIFDTPASATAYAKALHDQQDRVVRGTEKPVGFLEASKQLLNAEDRHRQDVLNRLEREANIWAGMNLEEESDLLKGARSFAAEYPHLSSVLSGMISSGSGLWGAVEWAFQQTGMDYQAGAASVIQDVANRYAGAFQTELSKQHFADANSKIDWALTKALENAPSMLISLGSIINPKTLSFVLGSLSAMEGGGQYHQLVKSGINKDIAAIAGVGYAVVAALAERMPIEIGAAVLKRYASLPTPVQRELATRLLYAAGFVTSVGSVEGLEEYVTKYGQQWIDLGSGVLQQGVGGANAAGAKLAATDPSLFSKDMLDAFMAGVAGGGMTGTVLGTGVVSGAMVSKDAATVMAEHQAKMKQAEGAAGYAQQLAEAGAVLAQTKAISLAPAGKEELAKAVQALDPEGVVVVDAAIFGDVLEQSGVSLAEVVKVAPSLRDQYVNARAMKSDLVIPTGEFLASLAATPAFPMLVEHVKPSTDAMSQAEATVFMQEQAAVLEKSIAAVIEKHAGEAEFKASSQRVFDRVFEALGNADRFTADVNRVYATQMTQFFTTLADKLGVTPEEAMARHDVGVVAESLLNDQRFDQFEPASEEDFKPGKVGNILKRGRWTILEAGNPMGQVDTPENNTAAMARLKAALDAKGVKYLDTIGRYGAISPSLLVFGVSQAEAAELGNQFGQESVLTRRGLVYNDGTLNPATGTVEEFTPGPDDDYYTTIPSLGVSFRVGIDFGQRNPLDDDALDQSASIRRGAETLKKYGLAPGKRYTVREVAAALEARQRAKYGAIDSKDTSPEAVKKIAKWMVEEVLFEMENPGMSGVGWYSDKFQRALDNFGALFPELLTDQDARDVFTLIIAVTSDGAKVMSNAAMAIDIYSNYRERGKIAFQTVAHNRDIETNLATVQELLDTYGPAGARDFLLQEKTVKELKALAKESGAKFNTEYSIDTLLPMSAVVLGPKLGAFYANLMGRHGYLTMDRWWSRTFNRYRGTLISAPTQKSLDRFRELTNQPGLSDDEVIAAVVPIRDGYKAKGYKNGTELEKMANTIYKFAFENLNDKPFRSSDRSFMIASALEAQKMLKRKGHDISIADLQAILWYYEKKLYGELGTREPGGISYEEAARILVQAAESDTAGGSAAQRAQRVAAVNVDPGSDTFAEGGTLDQAAVPRVDNVVGVHFSQAPRTSLDGRRYGTGAKGAEHRRVMAASDTRLRERVHFYVSSGNGVRPESDVGTAAHVSTLDNLYDADVDAQGFFRGASTDSQLNAAETAVIDAGYDGYLKRSSFNDQGTAVILGPASRSVDTEHVGGRTEANARAAVPAAAQYSSAQLAAQRLMALKNTLPAGAMEPQAWRERLAKVSPSTLAEIDAYGAMDNLEGPVYLDAIARGFYSQNEENPRGQIRFGKDITKEKTFISLLKGADLSTFLHESAHFYFEVYRSVATDLQARVDAGETLTAGEQSIVDDMNTLLDYLGVKPGQLPAGGNQAGTLSQTANTPKERAKAQGFDVKDTLYHWRAKPMEVFKNFAHVGTKQAADDRYMMPAGNGQTGMELMMRHAHGLPAEGAVYPVWINKTKVLRLGEDTGQHDVFNMAWSIGRALKDPALLNRLLDKAVRGMREDQLLDWAEEAGYDYLAAEDEGFQPSDYRDVIKYDYSVGVGQFRGTDGSMQDGGVLFKHINRQDLESELLGYLADRGITALSYVNNIEDAGSISYIIPDQRNVRSVHAKFEGTGQFNMLDQAALVDLGKEVVNPTGARMRRLVDRSTDGTLRGLFDSDGNLYVWDAYLATHDAGAKALGIPYDYTKRVVIRALYDGVRLDAEVPKDALSRYLRDSAVYFTVKGHGILSGPEFAEVDGVLAQSIQPDFTPASPGATPAGNTALEVWNNMSFEGRRAGHEQIARAFEAYLYEGKAPTVEMQGVFSRMKSWLMAVYKDIKAYLGAELTDEVRGVFDRMLATQDRIQATEAVRAYAPLFASAEQMGVTPEEWVEYQKAVAAGTETAEEDLLARSLRDMRWTTNARAKALKGLRKDAAVKRRAVRAEVEQEVWQEPVYAAMRFLRRGILPDGEQVTAVKLDLAALKTMYGEDANAPWRYLSTGPNGLAGNEGLHPDVVAEKFGLDSGDALVRALLAANSMESEIEGRTDQRMLERYGELADEASMQRAADEAVHNEARGKFVATELNALAKLIGKPKILAKAAKEFAASIINRKRVRDIRPSQFEVAETRAAKASMDALKAGNLIEAATEKRNQLVNFYAAKAAHEALRYHERALRYLKKFANKGTRKGLDPAYLEQIDGILADLDLRKLTQREMDSRTSLSAWIKAQEAAGHEPIVDEELLERVARKPFQELTIEELQGVVDSVKNIEHLGRLKKKLLTARDRREFREKADMVAASIRENANRTVKQDIEFNSPTQWAKDLWHGFLAIHRKFASRAREMDGGKDGGLVWETLIWPMNDAGNMETNLREQASVKLAALFKPIMGRHGWTTKMKVPGTNFSLSREGRIMLVLNWGTESSRQRVKEGGLDGKNALTDADMQAIINTLTKEEMDFVQGVWDLVGSFKGQIAAQERRLTGVEPKWLEPVPVETQHGIYPGGYFPAKYESRQSTRSAALEAATDLRQAMAGLFGRASARNSYTKERAKGASGRPLRKDFGVISQHLNEVIHRLSWQDWLTDATRLINDRAIEDAIREHYGNEVVHDIRDTVADLARGDLPPQGPLDTTLSWLRHGTSIAGMGWNLVTALLQPSGLTQSAERIGGAWLARGIAEYSGAPVKKIEEVFAKSDMMRLRAKTMQREINEVLNTIKEGEAHATYKASLFWAISRMQLQVDVPTWLGAYQKAMSELGMEGAPDQATRDAIEVRAIALADQAVLDSQGGGQLKDLAAVQRGPESQKLFTNFYSFFNTTYNLAAEAKNTKTAWQLPGSLILLFAIPAMYAVALKELLKGECDLDPECLAKRLGQEGISYMLGTMVLVRELSSVFQGYHGYTGPAGTRFFSEVGNLIKQGTQGEVDIPAVKAAVMTVAIPLHLPGTAINRLIEGSVALEEGDTDNILAPFVGVPRK